MKCPKCDYLGFETGDRCKNCGYDFSLSQAPPIEYGELTLKPAAGEGGAVGELWLDGSAEHVHEPAPSEPSVRVESSFPLFVPAGHDDEPLIKLPAEPRAPLAVRRAPDQSRARTAPRPPRKVDPGLTLEFADDSPAEAAEVPPIPSPPVAAASVRIAAALDHDAAVAGLGSRTLAALLDHAILLGIDLVVVYSTLRMANLTMDDWRVLPALPLLAFLALMKLAYFSAFTAMGGQTIGKMAAGIRVIADDQLTLDPARAIRRSLTGALSLLSLGLGLIPALLSADHRTFHDRVAHTRVVDLPSA